MASPAKKSKLKRDRKSVAVARDGLFAEALSERIENRSPTSEDPVLRRFIPGPNVDEASDLRRLGVIDWRTDRPAVAVPDINTYANRIICDDSESALKRLPSDSVHCIITSPPYWNVIDYGFEGQLGFCSYEDYLGQLLGVWRQCERILVPNGKLCINAPIMPISKAVMPDQHTRHVKNISNDIEASILRGLTLQRFSLYIWQKQTTEKMFGSYPYPPNIYEQNTIEFINVFVKPGKPEKVPKEAKETSLLSETEWMNLTRQIWALYPEDVKRAHHPAPFPESMPNRLLAMYTFAEGHNGGEAFAGNIVLDPFNGTGATCVAAKKLGRRYIGIDLSPHFCLMAQKRLDRTLPDPRIWMISDKKIESIEEAKQTSFLEPDADIEQRPIKHGRKN
jgi:modification methylase